MADCKGKVEFNFLCTRITISEVGSSIGTVVSAYVCQLDKMKSYILISVTIITFMEQFAKHNVRVYGNIRIGSVTLF